MLFIYHNNSAHYLCVPFIDNISTVHRHYVLFVDHSNKGHNPVCYLLTIIIVLIIFVCYLLTTIILVIIFVCYLLYMDVINISNTVHHYVCYLLTSVILDIIMYAIY